MPMSLSAGRRVGSVRGHRPRQAAPMPVRWPTPPRRCGRRTTGIAMNSFFFANGNRISAKLTATNGEIKMRNFTIAASILAVLFALLSPAPTLAQAVASAQIRGTVNDSTGAVVAGVSVKVTHTDTGQVRSTNSGNDGTFVFLNL